MVGDSPTKGYWPSRVICSGYNKRHIDNALLLLILEHSLVNSHFNLDTLIYAFIATGISSIYLSVKPEWSHEDRPLTEHIFVD